MVELDSVIAIRLSHGRLGPANCRTNACNGVGGRVDFEGNVARADPLMRIVRMKAGSREEMSD